MTDTATGILMAFERGEVSARDTVIWLMAHQDRWPEALGLLELWEVAGDRGHERWRKAYDAILDAMYEAGPILRDGLGL